MTTDAGNAAAPEDRATEEAAGGRPGLESSDPGSADSATTSERTADRGTEGSAGSEGSIDNESSGVDEAGTDSAASDDSDELGTRGADPDESGFLGGMLREAIVTGLPGETGAPPAEPHAPQAQQEGDEPVGAEPPRGDNPHGVD